MNNERILSHKMSKKLTVEELENVSAAGTTAGTSKFTLAAAGSDVEFDVVTDF